LRGSPVWVAGEVDVRRRSWCSDAQRDSHLHRGVTVRGGGIVEPLNEILFGTPTPPTFFIGPLNFLPAGEELDIGPSTLTPGTHLFICAIHPWMEDTVVVRGPYDETPDAASASRVPGGG
jgi:hypothetical protein